MPEVCKRILLNPAEVNEMVITYLKSKGISCDQIKKWNNDYGHMWVEVK